MLPWVGALLLAMGSLQVTLSLMTRGVFGGELRVVGTGLLVGMGGFGLVARVHGGRRWIFLAAGLSVGVTTAFALLG